MKLAIITINYNNAPGLQRTVESVLKQTSKDFEYIIIDRASTDGSKKYLEENSKKFTYWISEKDSGIYNAMNKGIKAASAEYLLFLNSGDELHRSDVVEKIIPHLHSYDLIIGAVNIVDAATYIYKVEEPLNLDTFYFNTIPHPSTFIKRDLFIKYGYYDETLKIAADWKFFMLLVIKMKATYKVVDLIVSTFYLDGISSNNESLSKNEREKIFNEEFPDYFRLAKKIETYEGSISRKRIMYLSEIEQYPFSRKIALVLLKGLKKIKI